VEQEEREADATRRMFGMLPDDQRDEFEGMWGEFEDRSTAEGRFARAIDALAPTWLHWGEHASTTRGSVTAFPIRRRKLPLLESYPVLAAVLEDVVDVAVSRGLMDR
jgi:putative hydrolase of HD superfamily